MQYGHLALDLASTIRHDGDGGVADDLATVDGLTEWVRAHSQTLAPHLPDASGYTADEPARLRVVQLRRAVRSLFADAVRPAAPSRADANRLLDPHTAATQLNAAAAAVRQAPQLSWSDEKPVTVYLADGAEPTAVLVAALARAGIEFLTGADRERLRACPAPRCVRYFIKAHPQQAWCKPSCGNRARVARHYQRSTGSDRPDHRSATGHPGETD